MHGHDGFRKRPKRLITDIFKHTSGEGKELEFAECLPCAKHLAFHHKTSLTAFSFNNRGGISS